MRRLTAAAMLIAACLATALFELSINPNLFVTPGLNGMIDPWVYTGFFLSLPSFLQVFPETYYGSRLSVLLPGFLAHGMFSPIVASYVLHLTLYCLLLSATYGLIRSGATRFAAVSVTLVMAWHPTILSALSWDYVDGFGIVFFVVALWGLERAVRARSDWSWGSIGAGVAIACMVTANLLLAMLVPVLAVFFRLRSSAADRRRMFAATLLTAVGALVSLAGFGAINVALGHTWWFLGPQLRVAQTLVAVRNPWQLAPAAWLARATWLALPMFATVGAILSCWRAVRANSVFGFHHTMQVVLLLAVAVWLVIHALGTPVLQLAYYCSYLAPLALMALPLQGRLPELDKRLTLMVAATTTLIFAAGHWLILSDVVRFWRVVEPSWVRRVLSDISWIGPSQQQRFLAAVVAVVAGSVGVAVLSGQGAAALRRWLAFAVCLTLTFGAAPPVWPAAGDASKAQYELTVAAHRFIAEHTDGRQVRLWYRYRQEAHVPVRSIASTYLWGFTLVNETLPVLTSDEAGRLIPGTRLVLLVTAAADGGLADQGLRQHGLAATTLARREFGAGDLAFSVLIADLTRALPIGTTPNGHLRE